MYPESRYLMGRAKLKTLKETTLQSFFKVCSMQNIKAKAHYQYNSVNGTINFYNGSQVLLKDLYFYPSDPDFDELGSLELTGAFIDEANQIVKKAKQIVRSRIRHNLQENDLIPKMLMTCNPAKNWTYHDFYKPSKNKTLAENKAFIQSLVTDNPNIDPSYIDNLKGLDVSSQERLLYGNWEYDDDPAKLLTIEEIHDFFVSNIVQVDRTMYLTADVALQGSDNFVLGVWKGKALEKVYKIDKCDNQEAINITKKIMRDHRVLNRHFTYDSDGVGAGFNGFFPNSKPFVNNGTPLKLQGRKQQFQNLATQCGYLLCEKIRTGEYTCSDTTYMEEITKELEQVKNHNHGSDDKIKIDKKKIKELLGYSPDFFDMLKMRVIFDIKPKGVKVHQV